MNRPRFPCRWRRGIERRGQNARHQVNTATARILQIADIYDALTTDRPYRGALSPEEALQTLFTEAGNGWLDASMVLKFSQICRYGESFPIRERTMRAAYYA